MSLLDYKSGPGLTGGQDVKTASILSLRVRASGLEFDMQCWSGLLACRDKFY